MVEKTTKIETENNEEENEITEIDFDNMSDEEFLKLDPDNLVNENISEQETETEIETQTETEEVETETEENNQEEENKEVNTDSEQEENETETISENNETETEKETTNTEKSSKSDVKIKLPEGVTNEQVTQALDFYKIITAPFKADGKEISVRSAEDAVRLMQQGANYSRRMQELKPLKQMNRILQDNGINNVNVINNLIDLHKGNKEAITDLLKKYKIDPIDLDLENNNQYKANNYAGNSQDNAFRDVLEETVAIPEGQALVSEINKDWDLESKKRLRENPAVVSNLLQLKQAGIYDKVAEELAYQRSIGHLTNIPYLQAFDQVGEAMKNAGVFNNLINNPDQNGNNQNNSMQQQTAPQQIQQKTPLASGPRKAVTKQKTTTPNPHLSSKPPTASSGNTNNQKEIDYSKLSDEDFLKLSPPSD